MQRTKTVLLAEDDEHDVFFMRRIFKKSALPHAMNVVADGEEAVAYLSGTGVYADRVKHPLPGLLLLDIKMPRRDGHSVLNWVRSIPELKLLPVVMLSASREIADIKRAYAAGANSFVVKPTKFESLEELIPLLSRYWLEVSLGPGDY